MIFFLLRFSEIFPEMKMQFPWVIFFFAVGYAGYFFWLRKWEIDSCRLSDFNVVKTLINEHFWVWPYKKQLNYTTAKICWSNWRYSKDVHQISCTKFEWDLPLSNFDLCSRSETKMISCFDIKFWTFMWLVQHQG